MNKNNVLTKQKRLKVVYWGITYANKHVLRQIAMLCWTYWTTRHTPIADPTLDDQAIETPLFLKYALQKKRSLFEPYATKFGLVVSFLYNELFVIVEKKKKVACF